MLAVAHGRGEEIKDEEWFGFLLDLSSSSKSSQASYISSLIAAANLRGTGEKNELVLPVPGKAVPVILAMLANIGVFGTKSDAGVVVRGDSVSRLSKAIHGSSDMATAGKEPEGIVQDFTAVVKSIEPAGVEDVYDVTVEDGHSLVFNGIATGNCSEILQVNTPSTLNEDLTYDEIGSDISCNLSLIHISEPTRPY